MRTIRVTGSGSVSVKPDTTSLRISFEGTYIDYEETVKQSAEKTKILREAIEKSGLHGEALKTKDFSIESEYESYRDYNGDYKKRFLATNSTIGHRSNFQRTIKCWVVSSTNCPYVLLRLNFQLTTL